MLITSYAYDSKRLSDFTNEFVTEAQRHNIDLDMMTESMGVLGLNNFNEWKVMMKSIIKSHDHSKMKALILLGQEAWATYINLDTILPNVPFYGCYVSDAGVRLPDTLNNPNNWEPGSISTEQLAVDRGGSGAVMFDFDIRGTIESAIRLCPDIENVAMITDNSYGGVTILAKYRNVMKNGFYRLRSIELDGRKLSAIQLKNRIDSLPRKTIILFGTWYVGYKGTFYSDKTIIQIMSSRKDIPVFTITGKYLKEIAISGVVPKFSESHQEFITNILNDIQNGKSEKIFIKTENEYQINYTNLEYFGLNKKLVPKDAVGIGNENKELEKLRKSTQVLSVIVCAFLIIILVIISLSISVRNKNNQLRLQKLALEKSEERAKKSDQLKSRFLANLSHEVNTPANGLLGFIQVLEEKVPNFESEFSKEIKESTYKLLDVINKIVEFSKLDTGMLEFDYEEFDICQVIQSQKERYMESCKSKNVEIISNMPIDKCVINWDKPKAERIISILVTNAIKFTHKGNITIGFYPSDIGITLYVSDTGIGIQEANQKRIFERFEKVDEFTEGAGLGLAFIKEITEKCGGKVRLVSKPDVGSRFILDIPCQIDTKINDIGQYNISEELNDPNTLNIDELQNSFKILVAEDSDVNFKLLQTMMQNHNLIRVENGRDAVELMKTDWYDLVLMDLRMPEMDGLTATREIRKFDSETPIIAVTAFSYDSDARKAKEAGCNDYINKPISRKSLYNAILGLM